MNKNHEIKKSVIFIDVDGTLYDNFKNDDAKIISEIFGNNRLIKFIDKILWKINGYDYIPNSINILKLRFFIYSIFSFINYSDIFYKYEERYKECLENAIININDDIFNEIKKKYIVVIITNNNLSYDILKKYFINVFCCPNVKERHNTIKKYNSNKDFNIEYIIGNNYSDDIKIAKNLGINSIYIGSSKIKSLFRPSIYAKNFDQALRLLLYRS